MNWNSGQRHLWPWIGFGVALLGLGVAFGFVGLMVGIDEAFAAKRWFGYALAALVSGLVVLASAGVGALVGKLRQR